MCTGLPSAPAQAPVHGRPQGTHAELDLLTRQSLSEAHGPGRSPWRAGLCLKLQAPDSCKAVKLARGADAAFLEKWLEGC